MAITSLANIQATRLLCRNMSSASARSYTIAATKCRPQSLQQSINTISFPKGGGSNEPVESQMSLFHENGFLKFDTLHELTKNASKAFQNNSLFGTFDEDNFKWMTYKEFGEKVRQCRSVLKDLGAST